MNKVSVYGGLGNQMFQYAFNTVLKAQGVLSRISLLHFFVNSHHNGFELLNAFNIELNSTDRFKLYLLKKGKFLWKSRLIKSVITPVFYLFSDLFENRYLEKQEYHYDSNVFNVRNSRFLGTWQSVKYLDGHESIIKEIFKFRTPLDSINTKLAEEIGADNTVVVHIRRGDYLNPEYRNSHLVIETQDYYIDAIEFFSQKLVDPVFYFFSDDMNWVKDNFHGSNFKFVDHNDGDQSYLDMYLMSRSSKFIIPNSTFSWWAAWLASNPYKEVICPFPWIKGRDIQEIYPENWRSSKV